MLSLLIAALSLSLVALAQILSLRPHVVVPPTADNNVLDSLDLLDILLLASVDGKFHALNRTSGDILWSMAAPAPSPSSPLPPAPLVRTDHIDYDPDLTDDSTPQHELYIIEPQSGDIYVLQNPSSPLQRFPFTMQQLVDMSPFSFSGDDADDNVYDGRVFVGKKETSLLVVELETGRIKATLNSECRWDQFEEFRKNGRDSDDEVDLDELEEDIPPKPPTTDIYIGRTDYHVSIITRPNPTSSSYRPSTPANHLIQNLSFSTYGPNKQDNQLQSMYRRTKDNAYTQPLPSGDILSFRARSSSSPPDEARDAEWLNKHLLWMRQEFNSPMVAVFDVLRKKPSSSLTTTTNTPRTFVLLQPRPKIQDLIPNLPSTVKVNPLSAYVGLVGGGDTTTLTSKGSLFVMSPRNYPLVAFGSGGGNGGGNRIGRNGEEGYPLIDSADAHSASSTTNGKEGPDSDNDGDVEEGEELKTVDQLTQLRKLRQASSSSSHQRSSLDDSQQQSWYDKLLQCTSQTDPSSSTYERHCLTGIRRLSQPQSPPELEPNSHEDDDDAQRIGRLLDPPPPSGVVDDYDYYKRYFKSTEEEWEYILRQDGGRLTIDPPPQPQPIRLGSNGDDESQSTSTIPAASNTNRNAMSTPSLTNTHTGISLGLSRWESILGTLVLMLVIWIMGGGEKWVRVLMKKFGLEEKRGVVEKEKEKERDVKEEEEGVKEQREEEVKVDALLSTQQPSTTEEVVASTITEGVEDKVEDDNDSIPLPPPIPLPTTPKRTPAPIPLSTPSTSSETATPVTPLPPTTPTPTPTHITGGGDETDKEDLNSDTEDFVVVSGGVATPKPAGVSDTPFTPGNDTTPMKKKKTRRGKRPAKKPKNLNGGEQNQGSEATNGNGKIESGVEGGDMEGPPQMQIPMASSLVLASTVKPVSTPGPSLVVSDTVLGYGSHGTVVYRGSLQGRAVAVKRLLADFVTLASREVSILQESDDHPNVIRYYYQESHAGFLYIALELCPASLADIIETPDRDDVWREIAVNFDPKRALRQVTNGLRHLHGLKLVHRDIKPQNILVTTVKGGRHRHASSIGGGGGSGVGGGGERGKAYRMLISDFGLCKKLDVDQTSFLPTANGAMAAGTVGWRAPEILSGEVKLNELADDQASQSSNTTVQGASIGSTSSTHSSSSNGTTRRTRLTKSVDIFALGCLYYYTLTNGGHPFGDRYEREVNIMKNSKNLEMLERFGEEGNEAMDLIEKMLDPLPSGRPDTTSCLLHPFFWDSFRRLNFLQDASDRFEIMCRDPKDPDLLTLETGAVKIVGNDWHSRLDRVFIENLGKFRKYDGKSVQDLLRALRNKKHHYQDLPDHVKRHLGPMPEGFLAYFTKRFPDLFLHVHRVIKDTRLADESMFRSYFELPDS